MPGSTTNSPSNGNTAGAKHLQERLHQLLTRLSSTIEIVKNWPESEGDDASIHVQTTTKLISAILEVTVSLQRVEGVVKSDSDLRKSLQDCPVPINLLDLLDHGNGLNPDCFSRGLLREALGQLAGLKRRKLALEMLGDAVQAGLNQRFLASKNNAKEEKSNKRQRDGSEEGGEIVEQDTPAGEPAAKKSRTEPEVAP